jgi:lactate permease
VFLRFWRPKVTRGFGGDELEPAAARRDGPGASRAPERGHGVRDAVRGLVPFGILVAVVVAWTGPWSPLPSYVPFAPAVTAISSLDQHPSSTAFKWAPFVAGTAILVSWLLICAFLRPTPHQLRRTFRDTFQQMWGAFLVAPFIFGLATVFNYSGMANSMANGFSQLGTLYVVLAPVLGWIAVALSGSNTSSNAVFGAFQLSVAKLLHAPLLLFPSLNSVGAEVGKPVAPQTASVGVGTTSMVRKEGEVIRYNMAWTLIILAYLILIGLLYYFVFPSAMDL